MSYSAVKQLAPSTSSVCENAAPGASLSELSAPKADTPFLSHPEVRATLGGGLASALERAFLAMEIAEDEIDRAIRKTPEAGHALFDTFRALRPPPILEQFGEELYRLHARELLARAARGEDLRPGTHAEVMAALAFESETHPVGRAKTLLYATLFAEAFPKRAASIASETGPMTPDAYEKVEMEELLASYRKKLSGLRFEPIHGGAS